MLILEARIENNHYIKLTPSAGMGRKQWELVEGSDDATRFTDRHEMETKLKQHHCSIRYQIHEIET